MFDDEQYMQINGTAMGTKMAPTYANIYMYYVENIFLSSFNLKPTAYFRYIDDVFYLDTRHRYFTNFFRDMLPLLRKRNRSLATFRRAVSVL